MNLKYMERGSVEANFSLHGCKTANFTQGFPLEFYFRGRKSPLTLIQGDISGDFSGQSYHTKQKKGKF